jgi:hypothetical protein
MLTWKNGQRVGRGDEGLWIASTAMSFFVLGIVLARTLRSVLLASNLPADQSCKREKGSSGALRRSTIRLFMPVVANGNDGFLRGGSRAHRLRS